MFGGFLSDKDAESLVGIEELANGVYGFELVSFFVFIRGFYFVVSMSWKFRSLLIF